MKRNLFASLILALALTVSAFAQTNQVNVPGGVVQTVDATKQVAKNDTPRPVASKAKEFKPELTPEEGALLRPVIDEFNKWSARLNAASEQLDKSDAAASPEIENLQIQLAAKDIRAARKELIRLRGEFAKWEAEIKRNHDCQDCRFDEVSGKLVKLPPPPASSPKK